MGDFVMPILGADMEAGTLVEWRKQPGDPVQRGEIVAEVETDKGLIEVEIFQTGVLEKIFVHPGEKVPVGTVLASIREEGAAAQPAAAATLVVRPRAALGEAPRSAPAPPPVLPPGRVTPPPPPPGAQLRVSPAARRLATELAIDLTLVRGSGPSGAILREDVDRVAAECSRTVAAAAPPLGAEATWKPIGGEERIERQKRMRQAIGAAMARSKREIPHYYVATTIDMQRAVSWLAEQNLKRPLPDRMLYGIVLIKAVALALRELPELNSVWLEGVALQRPSVNVGVAIALREGGLVAPALHDADRQPIDALWRQFRDLVQRARSGRLRSSELADSTITITSLGERGVELVFPIIYPPQVAIVGFGKLVERPWSVGGAVVSRPLVNATLAADHRVTDGHRGSLFLAAVDRLLQEPERL